MEAESEPSEDAKRRRVSSEAQSLSSLQGPLGAPILQGFFQHTQHMLAFVDLSGRIIVANGRFVDRLGREKLLDVVNQHYSDVLSPQAVEVVHGVLQVVRFGGVIKKREFVFVKPHAENLRKDIALISVRPVAESDIDFVLSVQAFSNFDRVTPHNSLSENLQGVHIICTDVTKEYFTREKLITSQRTAEGVSKDKSEMMSTITHEIRTPLVSVLGFSELLLDTDLTVKQKELVQRITRSGDVLLKLLNNFLDLAKVEADALDLETVEFKTLSVLQSVHELMSGRAFQKKISWELEVSENVPICAVGDQARLTQILINLVSNAIKFTSKNGLIRLRVEGDAELLPQIIGGLPHRMVSFHVSDTGVGISPDKQNQIFMPFQQAESSTSRKYGGTGLGLPLSQRLAALFGGTVDVESVVGKGSCFTLKIPLAIPEGTGVLEKSTYENEAASLMESSSIDSKSDGSSTASKRKAALPVITHGLAARGLRVLIVEDAIVNQLIFKTFLEAASIKVDVASDGIEAVELFKSRPSDALYDLILMDLQMPRLDGYGATKQIRALEKKLKMSRTPIIALTAFSAGKELNRCLTSGCDNYIIKPVKRNDLFLTICATLNLSETP